jgi:beta-lactam-binding protein with PASTA domain
MIAQGSKINLTIGDGMGNTEFPVPDVTKLTVDEAIAVLNQYNLQPIYTSRGSGGITDTAAATIVDQSPSPLNGAGAPNRIKGGSFINLTIQQNP